jgi:hypothetical protein
MLQNGFEDSYEEYVEYRKMHYIKDSETPIGWKNRIWDHLLYFRERNLHTYSEQIAFMLNITKNVFMQSTCISQNS